MQVEVRSPLTGTVAVPAAPGATVAPATEMLVVESMKVEHAIVAGVDGTVSAVHVAVGAVVEVGALLATVEGHEPVAVVPGTGGGHVAAAGPGPVDSHAGNHPADGSGAARADLATVTARHRGVLDEARPEAVARRRRSGQRTARENVAAVCDPGTFVEYGPLAVAAQRNCKTVEELIATTPADGLVGGAGRVGGHPVVVVAANVPFVRGGRRCARNQTGAGRSPGTGATS